METIIGGLLGGLFRLAPELMKIWDAKNVRAHEAAMFDKQLAADELKAKNTLAQTEAEGKITLTLEDIKALTAGVQAQAIQTGNKIIDGINSLMRPTITFWWVICLQTGVMAVTFYMALDAGKPIMDAIALVWGAQEKAIVASIISFWFVDRSIRLQNK